VAIVTGAAAGMGHASAVRLAAQGWPLILCDVNGERLEQAAAPLRADGGQVETIAGDIAAPDFIDRLIAMIGPRRIGAVVHAAGLSPTRGDAARILAVNYDATAQLVEAIRPRMAEGGCAVLISSSSGYYMSAPEYDAALKAIGPCEDSSSLLKIAPEPGLAYALSKRGVTRMVERQATAFGERKARIVSIAPGLIDTEMGRAESQDSAQMAAMLTKTPLGRYGTADEIAAVAVFLCSPEASYITGSEIKVDGGTLAATLS
jgi:NAD(P)-dependent dehydrogenase (short-subunit alcohol dehydrogenase family)